MRRWRQLQATVKTVGRPSTPTQAFGMGGVPSAHVPACMVIHAATAVLVSNRGFAGHYARAEAINGSC